MSEKAEQPAYLGRVEQPIDIVVYLIAQAARQESQRLPQQHESPLQTNR